MSDYNVFTATDGPLLTGPDGEGLPTETSLVSGNLPGLRIIPTRTQFDWAWKDLLPGSVTFGSSPDCDVVIPTEGVAPRHCVLIIGTQRNLIQAFSSRTWINEGAVTEGVLKPGDRLVLGPVELKISAIPAHTRSKSASPPQISAQHLDELLAAGRASAGDDDRQEAVRAHHLRQQKALLQELLNDVQQTLQKVIEREKDQRKEFSRERLVLDHRSAEIHRQLTLLEDSRRKLEADRAALTEAAIQAQLLEQRQNELKLLQADLNERHEELAARSSSLVRLRRELKTLESDLAARESEQASAPNSQEIESLRNQLARNQAQLRHLDARQRELEQKEAALLDQIHETQNLSSKLAHQREQFEAEKRDWSAKCLNRERFLEQLEDSLASRQQHVESEEQRLDSQRQELDQIRSELENQIQVQETTSAELNRTAKELEERQNRLDVTQSQLQEEHRLLELARRELDSAKAKHVSFLAQEEDRQHQIELQLHELQQREEFVLSREASLLAHQQDVERKRAEFERLQQQQAAELEEKQTQVALRMDACGRREQQFHARESKLESIRADLANKANEIEEAREALAAERLALTQTENDAKSLAERWVELDKKQIDLQIEQSRLAGEIEKFTTAKEQLQIDSNEIAAEQQNIARLRAELEAERQRDSYDREQLQNQLKRLEAQQQELEKGWLELSQAREELEQQKSEFQFLQETAENQVAEASHSTNVAEIEEELARLIEDREQISIARNELDQMREAFSRRQQEVESTSERVHLQMESLEAREHRLADQNRLSQQRTDELDESERKLNAEWETLHREREEFFARQDALRARELELSNQENPQENTPVLSLDHPPHTGQGSADVPPPEVAVGVESAANQDEQDDASALRLRNELANLFGISPTSLSSRERQLEDREPENVVPSTETAVKPEIREDDSAEEHRENHASSLPLQQPQKSPAGGIPNDSLADEEEISVAAYMERLLARSRSPQPSIEFSPPSQREVSPPPAPLPVQEDAKAPQIEEVIPGEVPERKRKQMDEGARSAIRENLQSFRQVANLSAREAVAKSTFEKKSSFLRNMIVVNVIGWIAAVALIVAEVVLRLPVFDEILIVTGISGVLTMLCLYRYKELRTLNSRHIQTSRLSEMVGKPAKEEPSEKSEQGPLSFL